MGHKNTPDTGNTPVSGSVQKLAILSLSPDLLRELLQLPRGAEILDLRVPLYYRGVLEVKIVGAGWPTMEGQAITSTIGTVTRTRDENGVERRSIDWGFPINL